MSTIAPEHTTRTNLADYTAAELIQGYATGQFSPVDAARSVLSNIQHRDPDINAYCLTDPDTTLAHARAAEARWHAGQPLSGLDGVPVSIKDVFLTTGWPTLRGSQAINLDQPWEEDSPVAARLRAAGSVFTGKTTTPELAWKAVTDSPLTGVTRNPHNTELTAGGSSGGAAAAVAAGMGPCAVGTDGGGSIRIPAAFCGIVGFKPTHGRVPMYPASPFGPLAHAGPMTRTVIDAATMMDVLNGIDGHDPTSITGPVPTGGFARATQEMHDHVGQYRIAYSPDLGNLTVNHDVAETLHHAADQLAATGLNIRQNSPNLTGALNHNNLLAAFDVLWETGAATLLDTMPGAAETVDPGLGTVWNSGERYTGVEYLQAKALAAQLGIALAEFFTRYDVLITPTVGIPPFTAGHGIQVPEGSGLERWPEWAGFSYPFNLTQLPAISIPAGTTPDGLPVGLQIIGPRFADDVVLAVARRCEAVVSMG